MEYNTTTTTTTTTSSSSPADQHLAEESSPWGSSSPNQAATNAPTNDTFRSASLPAEDGYYQPDGLAVEPPAPNSGGTTTEPAVASASYGPSSIKKKPRKDEKPIFRLQAKVTALERNGRKDPIRDPIIRFDVYTNLPTFRTTQYRDIRRTHGEFLLFAKHLLSANPEAIVPAVPPAVTAAGAGNAEDETKVKANMQRWLSIICSNSALINDEETLFFVEGNFGYSPVNKMHQPATGMRRKVIKQFAPPSDATVELADARPIVKAFYLATMDAAEKLDKVVKSRKALGMAECELGSKLATTFPRQDNLPGLSTAFRKMGNTIRTIGDFHSAQGTFEASSLEDALKYHSEDACVVKETLTNRQILMRDLKLAENATKARVSALKRLKESSTVKREKTDEAFGLLAEAQKHEAEMRKKCDGVTKGLLHERRRWFERTGSLLKSSVREYAIRQIEAERRTLAHLEAVRPDIRAIDSSGGLSRLGRESHPKMRRSSLASSQGPRGDAWSGVQRRAADGVRRLDGGVDEDDELLFDERFAKATTAAAPAPKSGALKGLGEEHDEDRVDARNAASRLAQPTF